MKEICDLITQVLESWCTTELPLEEHVMSVVHSMLPDGSVKRSSGDNMPHMYRNLSWVLSEHEREEYATFNLKRVVQKQQGKQNMHQHRSICRDPPRGRDGCRLCRPFCCVPHTCVMELKCMPCAVGEKVVYNFEASQVNQVSMEEFKEGMEVKHVADDPLERIEEPMIAWELKRPELQPLPTMNNEACCEDTKTKQISLLYELVLAFDPAVALQLDIALRCENESKVDAFYQDVRDKLLHRNGLFVECNAHLSLCTGSHHNFSLLGCSVQGKAAMFYITSYLSKNKNKLANCILVLLKVLKERKKRKSTAADAALPKREMLKMLQRTMNKIYCKMEMSDYQVAAALLGMPVEITPDIFAFDNPDSHYSFICKEKVVEDVSVVMRDEFDDYNFEGGSDSLENHFVLSSSFDDIGKVPIYMVKGGSDKEARRVPVPYQSHYRYRGKELRLVSRVEYRGMVDVGHLYKKIGATQDGKGRKKSKSFKFSTGHLLCSSHVQRLSSKQRLVAMSCKVPKLPGPEPESKYRKKQWRERADKFARYLLVCFRPEQTVYDNSNCNDLQYDWTALQKWLAELRSCTSLVARLRLRVINNHLYGNRVEHCKREVFAKFRARCRKMWNEDDLKGFACEDYYSNDAGDRVDDSLIDSLVDGFASEAISSRQLNTAVNQLKFCKALTHTVDSIFGGINSTDGETSDSNARGSVNAVSVVYPCINAADAIRLGKQIKSKTDKIKKPDGVSDTDFIAEEAKCYEAIIREFEPNADQQKLVDWFESLVDQHMRCISDGASRLTPSSDNFVLVTGPPGVGKSYVCKYLKARSYVKGLSLPSTAYMGIAMVNADGCDTISGLVSLKWCKETGQTLPKTIPWVGRLFEKRVDFEKRVGLRNIVAIIIDEISMVSPVFLGALSQRFQEVFDNFDLPFGGLPVLAFGDFSQLPPVGGSRLYEALINWIMRDVMEEVREEKVRASKRRRNVG